MMRQKGPLKHLDLKTTDAKMLDLGSSSKLGFRCISQLLFFLVLPLAPTPEFYLPLVFVFCMLKSPTRTARAHATGGNLCRKAIIANALV